MPETVLSIVNKGLGKLSATRVNSLMPPRSEVEKRVAEQYEGWRDSELMQRVWVFARRKLVLTQTEDLGTEEEKRYGFALPANVLRPIREKAVTWEQRGRTLYYGYNALTIYAVIRAPEHEFDPMFVDVLACRVALEMVGSIVQSEAKKNDLRQDYRDAIAAAGRNNAFVLGPENYAADDEAFDWLTARYR